VLGGLDKGLEYIMLAIGEINKAVRKDLNEELLKNIITFFPIIEQKFQRESKSIRISEREKKEYISILKKNGNKECIDFIKTITNLSDATNSTL
jgi:hypothetical protein